MGNITKTVASELARVCVCWPPSHRWSGLHRVCGLELFCGALEMEQVVFLFVSRTICAVLSL